MHQVLLFSALIFCLCTILTVNNLILYIIQWSLQSGAVFKSQLNLCRSRIIISQKYGIINHSFIVICYFKHWKHVRMSYSLWRRVLMYPLIFQLKIVYCITAAQSPPTGQTGPDEQCLGRPVGSGQHCASTPPALNADNHCLAEWRPDIPVICNCVLQNVVVMYWFVSHNLRSPAVRARNEGGSERCNSGEMREGCDSNGWHQWII